MKLRDKVIPSVEAQKKDINVYGLSSLGYFDFF